VFNAEKHIQDTPIITAFLKILHEFNSAGNKKARSPEVSAL
jgi:hypothetical protein